MKIAVMAGFFAKRNMDVNAGQVKRACCFENFLRNKVTNI